MFLMLASVISGLGFARAPKNLIEELHLIQARLPLAMPPHRFDAAAVWQR